MTKLEKRKLACGKYYNSTKTIVVDGQTLYKTEPRHEIRDCSVGYFPSEEEAVEVLYKYLVKRKMIGHDV